MQNIRVGDGLQGPDGRLYEITNVSSDTALAIEPAYMGATASGQAYWIIPVHGYLKKLADEAAGLVRSVGLLPGEVESNERRIANAEQDMLTKLGNLAGLKDIPTARNNLGLGNASVREVQASQLDSTGGRLLQVGGFGLGGYLVYKQNADSREMCGFYYDNTVTNAASSGGQFFLNVPYTKEVAGFRISAAPYTGDFFVHTAKSPTEGWLVVRGKLWHSGNTTIDSNGFIKRASPIVHLSCKSIEKTDHKEIEQIGFKRISVGVYELSNAPLLSRDGWYIETPKDRNGNIYFTLDYEEADGVLTIRTYTPDYSTGPATNGEPVDILEGRFVSLRFAEDPSLYPKPEMPEQDVPAA
ncbi:hypothetical protein ACLPHM_05805 [Paenalcaligenes sp. Me131]|uniref:phage tail fiber protein n=1 Tax=Paenalcaligenes sp. Me131 TaxID=3392636 RepID=UPI003D29768E